MNVTRRSAASVIAGLPFIGGGAAKAIGGALAGNGPKQGYASGGAGQSSMPNGQMPQGPKMQEWQACRLAMLDPDVKKLLIEAAYAQNRVVSSVDPDIEVLRSFSPMAKIAFQRQRNVAKALKDATEAPIWSWGQRGREYIQKLMWGNQ